jgi:hypothetical protein
VRTRCVEVLYGVVGTGLLCDVSTLCVLVPPPGLYGVVGTGLLWDVSTLFATLPPPGLMGWWAPVCCGVSVQAVVLPA